MARVDRAQAAEALNGAALSGHVHLKVGWRNPAELVVTKSVEELGVVVLHAEHEAEPLDSSFGLGAENERAVGQLACCCRFAAAQHASEDAVPKTPCRVRRAPCGERE